MKSSHILFVHDCDALEKALGGLKHRACPYCGKHGYLNRHSFIEGNDPNTSQGRLQKGQRVYCSNRGRRGGCGRTFAILLSCALARHTFSASLLGSALEGWLNGGSIKASWEAACCPLQLDTFYHLLQRMRRRLSALRTDLCKLGAAPPGVGSDPLRQSLLHLRHVLLTEKCPLQSFQEHLQRSLVG